MEAVMLVPLRGGLVHVHALHASLKHRPSSAPPCRDGDTGEHDRGRGGKGRRVAQPAAGCLLPRLGRARGRLLLDLAHLLLRPRLHVCLGGQRLGRLAELLAGLLDVFPQLTFGPFGAHRCVLSLISSTSAFTLPIVSSGTGGVALASRPLPSSAAAAASSSSAAPTMSAASHAARTEAIAMTAQAIRQPSPSMASPPLPANRPIPRPACLPFRVISSCASRSSSLTRWDTCSDRSFTSSPVGRSCAVTGREPVVPSLINSPSGLGPVTFGFRLPPHASL